METYSIPPEIWADKEKRGKALLKIHRKANRPEKSPLLLDIGKAFREKRKSQGFTTLDIEKETGISNGYISNFETGSVNATIELLERLAKSMNCKVEISFVRNKNEAQPEH